MRRIEKLKNIQKANIIAENRYLIENFNLLLESHSVRNNVQNILNNKGVEDYEMVANKIMQSLTPDKVKYAPYIAFMYDGKVGIDTIAKVMVEYDELSVKNRIGQIALTNNGIKIGEKLFSDFLSFSEFVHGKTSLYLNANTSSTGNAKATSKNKPIWSGNKIDIYDGNDVRKCIEYNTGGLTGQSYSFCIGVPGSGMFKSYRDSQESSFYYIVDWNHVNDNGDGSFDFSDPLHIVVFDKTNSGVILTDKNNNTGNISKYGSDAESYINYLKSKGVPVDKLAHIPKSEQEKYEDALLDNQEVSLSWFINLDNPKNPNYRAPKLKPGQSAQNYYKSAYIGRGHILTDEQFDFLNG